MSAQPNCTLEGRHSLSRDQQRYRGTTGGRMRLRCVLRLHNEALATAVRQVLQQIVSFNRGPQIDIESVRWESSTTVSFYLECDIHSLRTLNQQLAAAYATDMLRALARLLERRVSRNPQLICPKEPSITIAD